MSGRLGSSRTCVDQCATRIERARGPVREEFCYSLRVDAQAFDDGIDLNEPPFVGLLQQLKNRSGSCNSGK